MASLWMMEWDGVGPDKYEELRRKVDWEGKVPQGLQMHVAAFDERGLVLTELWDSPEDLQAYVEGRFLPGIEALGIEVTPGVELYLAHSVFTPAFKPA